MKKKLIIFTLCFTLLFSSINFRRSYAFDGGVISLPMLATVSALAVGTNVIINNSDDLYDLGRMFYNWVKTNNDLTWQSVQSVFSTSVALQPNKLVSVDSKFLDIVKSFLDDTFSRTSSTISIKGTLSTSPPGTLYVVSEDMKVIDLGMTNVTYGVSSKIYAHIYSKGNTYYLGHSYDGVNIRSQTSWDGTGGLVSLYYDSLGTGTGRIRDSITGVSNQIFPTYFDVAYDFPYNGGYVWDNVDSKKENEIVALPIPGDLGQLVGQVSKDFWDNTDNLVNGDLSLPNVSNPTIGVDSSTSFPSVDSSGGVLDPSLPNEGILSTIKDFIISLVVPNDSFWTDTWGGLYNNFTDSFPMVDMSGFNDLVTGEKKFPNIDINIMGITGRVVNGDVINSIVEWLRPIIAGFMMICLMLFNYRKIYKLIRNTEPFGGIAPGTSDFKTGISEYTHVGLVNDGFKRSEEEEFARSRYYEEMHFKNGGKL